jgi:hypothetical protein
MNPYSADDTKRKKENSFIPRRESEKGFKPLSSQLWIPGTMYRIQLGLISGKWASRVIKGNELTESYVYRDEDLSTAGFPNQNLIVGWLLRTVAIPNINPHQIMKTVQALTKQALRRRDDDHLPFPTIYKPPEPPDDIGIGTNVQLNKPVDEEVPEVELFCSYCGSKLTMDERFCSVCGKKA